MLSTSSTLLLLLLLLLTVHVSVVISGGPFRSFISTRMTKYNLSSILPATDCIIVTLPFYWLSFIYGRLCQRVKHAMSLCRVVQSTHYSIVQPTCKSYCKISAVHCRPVSAFVHSCSAQLMSYIVFAMSLCFDLWRINMYICMYMYACISVNVKQPAKDYGRSLLNTIVNIQ